MREMDRKERNRTRLGECHPGFSVKVAQLIHKLESDGFRPRIQDAWRSPKEQKEKFKTGRSKLEWGFHNACKEDDTPEALAVDLLDDDQPLAPSKRYLLALAVHAEDLDLRTGVLWGLPKDLSDATRAAIEKGDFEADVKIGWDPTHVQVTGISLDAAREEGKRPAVPEERPAEAELVMVGAPDLSAEDDVLAAAAAMPCNCHSDWVFDGPRVLRIKVTTESGVSQNTVTLQVFPTDGPTRNRTFEHERLAAGVEVDLPADGVTIWQLAVIPTGKDGAVAASEISIDGTQICACACSSTGGGLAGQWQISTVAS